MKASVVNFVLLQAVFSVMSILLTYSYSFSAVKGGSNSENQVEKEKSKNITCNINTFFLEKAFADSVLKSCALKRSITNLHKNDTCFEINRSHNFNSVYVVKELFWKFQSYQNQQMVIVCLIRQKFSSLSKNIINQGVTFKIKPLLQKFLFSNFVSLLIQFGAIVHEPSWTVSSLTNQFLTLVILKNGKKLRVLPHPIDIYFKCSVKNYLKLTKGFLLKASSRESKITRDDLINVYNLNIRNRSGALTVFIKFHHLKADEEFKVLVSRNIWPDYDTMILNSKTISIYENSLKVKIENISVEDNYYLGISSNILETQSSVGGIQYNFEVRYLQCLLKHGDEWSSQDCYLGEETTDEVLHCRCRHLSMFGGHAVIPPRELDLVSDIHLILDIKDNPRTVLLVSSLILVYLIVLVWTRHSDRKDRLQRQVVVLADNYPGETWPYLVTVFTGLWIGAGTEANVALRLYGTKGMSRVHILQSNKRKVLKQNCDDWFLIFTSKSIGEIEKIHLFHDHTGRSHDWYCSKILVYDLKEEQLYKFIIEKWLSLKEVDECVELYAYPTPTLKYLKRGRIIRENIIFGLRETHLLLSIFTRHPRTSVTRSQRLSICLCIVIVHLLTSIMFYQIDELSNKIYYSAHSRPIIISMESTFLATPFTFIVIFCFKKSRVATAPLKKGKNVPMTLTAKMAVPLESGLQANQSSSRWVVPSSYDTSRTTSTASDSCQAEGKEDTEDEDSQSGVCQYLHSLLFQVLLVQPMMPVRILDEEKEEFRIRKKWLFAAWFLCSTAIIAGGIFIILYSLKLDYKLSDEWMQTSFRYSLANIFLMSPVKIIIFAIILAMLYGQLQYIPSYKCDTDAALNRESVGNAKFLSKILKNRRRKCYRPLNNKENVIIRAKTSNWRHWRIVINFGVVILLYAVLSEECVYHWHGPYQPTSKNLLQMFADGRNITGILSYFEYLITVALPALDNKFWYSGQPTMYEKILKQESGFTQNYLTRLMARPILRQQRTTTDSCRVPEAMVSRFSRCYAPLARFSTGDQEEFSAHWVLAHAPRGHLDNPWVFSDSNSHFEICGLKSSKCYLPGGYISKLDYNQTESERSLRKLKQSAWLNEATRVVILELVMYNANTDMMSYVTPTMEKLADGSFQFLVKVTTLHSRPASYKGSLVIILCFTFYYLCRTILLFNREGLAYIFSSIGVLDIFLNIFLYVSMISLTLYNEARKAYIYEWYERNREDLIMTKDIFVHRAILRYEIAILVLIIPAQLLHNFRFGRRYLQVFKTLTLYFKFTLLIGLSLVIFRIAFSQICIINGKSQDFFTMNNIFGRISHGSIRTLHFFCMIFHFLLNVMAIFTVVISLKCYSKGKEYMSYNCDFNIFFFLCEKLKRVKVVITEMKISERHRKQSVFRVRAGADVVCRLSSNRSCGQVRQICSDLYFKCNVILEKLTDLDKTF